MSSKEKALVSGPELAARRPRGRPRKPNVYADSSGLSREAIILKATHLAQTESLDEISIMRLGREFGVVPGLIHYYLGSRDELLSGVVNNYLQDLVRSLPAPSGEWRGDVRRLAHASMQTMLKYRGVVAYTATHNRFRLFQKVAPGETDYGLELFNAVGSILRRGGLSSKATAMGYHLLMQFIVFSAVSEISGLTPVRHENYIRAKLSGLDETRYAGALHMAGEFARLDFKETFDNGLEMLIEGIAALS